MYVITYFSVPQYRYCFINRPFVNPRWPNSTFRINRLWSVRTNCDVSVLRYRGFSSLYNNINLFLNISYISNEVLINYKCSWSKSKIRHLMLYMFGITKNVGPRSHSTFATSSVTDGVSYLRSGSKLNFILRQYIRWSAYIRRIGIVSCIRSTDLLYMYIVLIISNKRNEEFVSFTRQCNFNPI